MLCAKLTKPHVTNALRYYFWDVSGMAVVYTCLIGYQMEMGGVSRSAVCINGTWVTLTVMKCACKYVT